MQGSIPDNRANALLGLGIADVQLKQAAEFYTRLKQAYGDNIVFTGHSLSGGLAAVMGVFFDKPAYTFDPAPFRLAASKQVSLGVATYLAQRGLPVDAALTSYTTQESRTFAQQSGAVGILSGLLGTLTGSPAAALATATALGARPYPTPLRGEPRVVAVAARGEFLTESQSGTDLVITRDGSDRITVEGWQPGQLGITLSDRSDAIAGFSAPTDYIHAFGIQAAGSARLNRSVPTAGADHFGIAEDQASYSFGDGSDYIWERDGAACVADRQPPPMQAQRCLRTSRLPTVRGGAR